MPVAKHIIRATSLTDSRPIPIRGGLYHLTGTACTNAKFVDPATLRRRKYSPGAFLDWMHSGNSAFTTLMVDHLEALKLSPASLSWNIDRTGLHFSGYFKPNTDRDRMVMRAIFHGLLRHCSIGCFIERSEMLTDSIGRYEFVTRAEVVELSLTARPAVPGTSLSFAGWDNSKPTLPADNKQRRALCEFMSSIDVFAALPVTPKPVASPGPRRMTSADRELLVRTHQAMEQVSMGRMAYV